MKISNLCMFIGIGLFFIGAIILVFNLNEEKNVPTKCYDKYSNEILGQTCLGYSTEVKDLYSCSALLIGLGIMFCFLSLPIMYNETWSSFK